MFFYNKDEDAYSLPEYWKPSVPDLCTGDDDKESLCPCPVEYTNVSYRC